MRTTKRILKTHLTVLPKAVYKFSVIPIKLPMEIFIEQNFFTTYIEIQKIPHSQSNLEKEN